MPTESEVPICPSHNVSLARFELMIDHHTAVLDYTRDGAVITIHHTFVPVELRGKGVAGALAGAAFQYARDQGLRVIPACSYIATYAKRLSEAEALARKD